MKYDRINKLATFSYQRFIGSVDSRHLFGVGLLNKANRRVDQLNLVTDHYTLVYVLRGEGRYVDANDHERQLSAGNYFQRIPGMKHSTLLVPDRQWMECYVVIGMKLFEALADCGLLPLEDPIGQVGVQQELVSRFVRLGHVFVQQAKVSDEQIVTDCLDLLFHFFQRSRRQLLDDRYGSIVEAAQDYVSCKFMTKVDWREFCHQHRCSYDTFRLKFKEYTGKSPGRYYLQCRLAAACDMLSNTSLPIGEVAERLGYGSLFEFSAQFKKHVGMAPSHWAGRRS